MKRKKLTAVILSAIIYCLSAVSPLTSNADNCLIKGDVNGDDVFNVADVVAFQKWLLAETNALDNGKSADFNEDDMLDVFDLCLMKKLLIQSLETPVIQPVSSIYCKSSALYCIDDKTMLYADKINETVAPASLTKLLTASVALYYLSPQTVITVGTELNLVNPYSSLCLIQKGHRMKLYDLLTGMLMASGNDAAYTIAVATARAVYPEENLSDIKAIERFNILMNDFADSIGMNASNFTSSDGYDTENQYTTVKDLLILAKYAFSVPEIREITGTYQKRVVIESGEVFNWTNTNNLINPNSAYYCPYAVGMKTGSTEYAGNCLISSFEKNKKIYISVVMGCNTSEDRYRLTSELISELKENNENITTESITTTSLTTTTTETTSAQPVSDENVWSVKHMFSDETAVAMTAEDSQIIRNYCFGCKYENGTGDCLSDYIFITQTGQQIYYHSECGTFNDIVNNRSYKAVDYQRDEINSILNKY
ncbi:MAG: hypothetical protein K2O29_08560 [Ruminococcus sp.]|nr:hypothetical protein [Ruminococcus sp.]MDE7138491.1 hypothetical protein [Ruminococcus sp.]